LDCHGPQGGGTEWGLAVRHHWCDKYGGDNTWRVISDRRLKTDIRAYERGLATVLQLQPVSYRYNDLIELSDGGRTYQGLLAEDVLPIMPEMVSQSRRRLRETDAEDTEILMLNSSALTFALVNAVKELAATNTALERRIRTLEARRR
jgi:trimeric autotransporter adhesin